MGTELDFATLAISMILTIFLLFTHVIHFWKASKESKLHRRRHKGKENVTEFLLILTFIILDIGYFIIKYTAHLGAYRQFDCSTITSLYLSVMATSIWSVELFFLVRGWRILQEMKRSAKLLDIDPNSLVIFDWMCKGGIAFVIVCSMVTVVLVTMFVEYKEDSTTSLCVPTGRYKHEIMISAFSLMVCAVMTGVMALVAFAKPLRLYQAALTQRISYAEVEEEADQPAIRRSNTMRTSLKNTLLRVCVCLCVVHVMFLISGVFHILVNSPGSWGYGSRKIYRSLYCGCSVLMIVSMEMTYQNWRKRMFPFVDFCGLNSSKRKTPMVSKAVSTTNTLRSTES